MASAVLRIFNFWLANTIWWTSVVSGVAMSIGRPEKSATVILVRPQLNPVNLVSIIDIDGAESL